MPLDRYHGKPSAVPYVARPRAKEKKIHRPSHGFAKFRFIGSAALIRIAVAAF